MATVAGHQPISLDRITFCGVRDLSDAQYRKLVSSPARAVFGHSGEPSDLRVGFAKRFEEVLGTMNEAPCLVHFDLDCLDIQIGKANAFAAPGGLSEKDLLQCCDLVGMMRKPVGLIVSSFDPHLEGSSAIAEVATNAVVHLMGLEQSREGHSWSA